MITLVASKETFAKKEQVKWKYRKICVHEELRDRKGERYV